MEDVEQWDSVMSFCLSTFSTGRDSVQTIHQNKYANAVFVSSFRGPPWWLGCSASFPSIVVGLIGFCWFMSLQRCITARTRNLIKSDDRTGRGQGATQSSRSVFYALDARIGGYNVVNHVNSSRFGEKTSKLNDFTAGRAKFSRCDLRVKS